MADPEDLQFAQQIVDTLKTVCTHDINYINPQGIIIASSNPDRVGSYHAGGHEAAKSGRIVSVEEDDEAAGVRKGINMPIFFHKKTASVIGITGEPEHVKRYADLAQRITLLLMREQEVENHKYDIRTQTSYLVRALVEDNTVHPDYIREVLALNGIKRSSSSWQTVLFRLAAGQEHPLSEIEQAIEDAVMRLDGVLRTRIFPDRYILLMEEHELEKKGFILEELAARLTGSLSIGIGGSHGLARQARSYKEALLAIRSLPAGRGFAAFTSMRIELLLSDIGRDAGDAYIKQCTAGLDDEDLRLLDIYYSADMSLKETASACFIHKNTLQYRLDRIAEHCGLNPRRFRDAAELYLALRLRQFSSP